MGFSLSSITKPFKKAAGLLDDVTFGVFQAENLIEGAEGMLGLGGSPDLGGGMEQAFRQEQMRLRKEKVLAQTAARDAVTEGKGISRAANFSFGDEELDLTGGEEPETYNPFNPNTDLKKSKLELMQTGGSLGAHFIHELNKDKKPMSYSEFYKDKPLSSSGFLSSGLRRKAGYAKYVKKFNDDKKYGTYTKLGKKARDLTHQQQVVRDKRKEQEDLIL